MQPRQLYLTTLDPNPQPRPATIRLAAPRAYGHIKPLVASTGQRPRAGSPRRLRRKIRRTRKETRPCSPRYLV